MSKPLPSKEQGLFRQVVQSYENKSYKKGLKAADQILKKHSDHGDTIAMKALIINNQGKTDEAFELAKQALKFAMKSQVCWHVYGMLYRSVKNYEEAAKAYKFAQRLDPDSPQIQRDLALLLVQMRDYPGFVQVRKTMLQQRPGFRQNWTAMAIAHQLNGELDLAENVLTTFEKTLKGTPPKTDVEHAGATIYKNTIIAESGDTARALEHLDTIYQAHPDRTAVMELRASYLLQLGRKEEAEKAYRKLLGRNLDNWRYYNGLEAALALDRSKSTDKAKLWELYKSYSAKSERIDGPRRIPLDFLDGDDFKTAADAYLRRMLRKGVPSTFANVKALYSDVSKRETIQQLVLGYESEAETSGDTKTNGDKPNPWKISVLYFLAQHYNFHLSRDLTKAQSYIDQCVDLNTSDTEYTYHMTKARIYKHQNDTQKASETMEAARQRDLKDRYINTKAAKYQLRNNQTADALATLSLFTRKEAVGGALGDLTDMQCMWYLYESGRAHGRLSEPALALKRYRSVHDVFDQWVEDQFDFHSFSLRKGQIAVYVEMLRWEDTLRRHPFYTRAALAAIALLVGLHDAPAANGKDSTNGTAEAESAAKKKAAAKKARKDAEKAEADKKAAAAASATATSDDDKKKEDPDPSGAEAYALAVKDPLAEAMRYVNAVVDLATEDKEVQIAGFEVYVRRKKYLPALKCLLAAERAGLDEERVRAARERLAKDSGAEGAAALPDAAAEVLKEGLAKLKV